MKAKTLKANEVATAAAVAKVKELAGATGRRSRRAVAANCAEVISKLETCKAKLFKENLCIIYLFQ